MPEMTAKEHLAWAKERAKHYIDQGDHIQAWSSFTSDMNKHEGTRGHDALMFGHQQLVAGFLSTPEKMWNYIEGFN